jgi:hypothetical protein
MQKSAAVALFLGSASSMSINYATISDDASFIQVTASAAAKANSGVRARWTELPDCFNRWCNFLDVTTGKPYATALDGQPSGDYNPLRDDLANAAIADCKGPQPTAGDEVAGCPRSTPATDSSGGGGGGWSATASKFIYDPVWKTSTVIPDIEHQVVEAGVHDPNTVLDIKDHQKKIINQTQQVTGPKGLFSSEFNWEKQSKDASWDPESGGGVNYTGDMTTETFHGWNPAQMAATDAPWTDALVFIGEEHDKKWVELPDCSGAGDEIKLAFNLENSTVANCKDRPAA